MTGSRSDTESNDPTIGFAHVVNGAKKGFVAREGSGGSGGPIHATDAENLNWVVDSDLHSSFVRVKLVLQDITRGQCYKTFLSIIDGFSYLARMFVRLSWKSLPRTSNLAYYENP